MKAYLITTGTLFALLAIVHLLWTISQWRQLTTDPWFMAQGPGIGLLAALLCYWAWHLLRLVNKLKAGMP